MTTELHSGMTLDGDVIGVATYDMGSAASPIAEAYIGNASDYLYVAIVSDIPTIYGTGAYVRIGDAVTTQNSLNSEDDLLVTGELEVIGQAFFGYDANGLDVKLFGEITGSYLLWDASEEALVIHQGATDTPFLFVRSSDVTTGLTTAVLGSDVTTNDYLTIEKSHDDYGGVWIQALMEDGAYSATPIFLVEAYGSQADTTKSTAGRGLIEFYATEHNGSNTLANVTNDGNIFAIRSRVGGSTATQAIISAPVSGSSTGGLWLNGGITVGGVGVSNNIQNFISGSFVAGTAGSSSEKQLFAGELTASNGSTTRIDCTRFAGSIVTQNNSETIGVVAQVFIAEPTITIGNDNITVAASLYILDAPTEGVTNAGIWIVATNLSDNGIRVEANLDLTEAYNGIYVNIDTGGATGWGSGNVVGGRFKVDVDGSNQVADVTAVWAGLIWDGSNARVGLACAVNIEVEIVRLDTSPNAILYLQSLPGASANCGIMPFIVFSETRGGGATGCQYLFELGHVPASTTVTTGDNDQTTMIRTGGHAANNILLKQGIQIILNGADYYIPIIANADWVDDGV